jgi:hypothetical protein
LKAGLVNSAANRLDLLTIANGASFSIKNFLAFASKSRQKYVRFQIRNGAGRYLFPPKLRYRVVLVYRKPAECDSDWLPVRKE